MNDILKHPHAPERTATVLRGREIRLAAQKKSGVTAVEHAIELTGQLRRATGFSACDALIAGYRQTRAQLNGIRPTALPTANLLALLLLRIRVFEDLFILLTHLAVLQTRSVSYLRQGPD